ncbi:polysaccharide lyase family 8 super-sandwich domain-containing protein [Pedobacter xixiisoli]|uniref:Por secretion system C-terminal sorting domain-containing protein n=1 Tax=Pedobacter xixiisoli TaxID=1476464 RepID=A0A286ACI7_9SPHI|nr:polysaccharide lyase family 8 super-sandwich domain-containing protein [Pedobacter xixiisoli]SOD19604.1 Por secretion system C-terminal sorting domain-containing protein [Pedobacter xixiisoli]
MKNISISKVLFCLSLLPGNLGFLFAIGKEDRLSRKMQTEDDRIEYSISDIAIDNSRDNLERANWNQRPTASFDYEADRVKIMAAGRKLIYSDSHPGYSASSIAAWATTRVNNQKADGSWALTYTGKSVEYTHVDNLRIMAIAYSQPGTAKYNEKRLYDGIVKGLEYWYGVNPTHSNWYYNNIAYPSRIAETLLVMRYGQLKIPADLEAKMFYLLETKAGSPANQNGSNRTQIARHWIYRACLKNDKNLLDQAIEYTFDPLTLTTGFGIQHDYSFHAHGPQLYIGGYGRELVEDIAQTLVLCDGTSYQLSSERLNVYSNFLRQTYLRAIRGRYYLYNILGRSIAFRGRLNQGSLVNFLKIIKIKDPAYATIYDQAIARINESQPSSYQLENIHTHYHRSDYTLHSKPEYTFDIRTVSKRTERSENGNNESLLGYFLADGGTNIGVTGTEYYNIFPTWNWAMIPGTTARNGTMVRPTPWGTEGNRDFVGGVSDTTRGVSVYDMDSNNTRGKKAWFFFDDEVVCLGAGINSIGAGEVNTTLNQCLLQGDVNTFSQDGVLTTYTNNNVETSANNLKWVLHGKVGYVIPEGGNSDIGLTALPRTGKWSDITSKEPSTVITNNVFTLWLKHGVTPQNGNYAYVVVPNKNTAEEMNNYVVKNDITILSNTSQIQAVRHKKLNLHSFIFHSANQTFANDTISVNTDKPCLLMVQPMANGKIRLHVSDPTKAQTQITIKAKWKGENIAREITIPLITGNVYGGQTAIGYLPEYNVLPLKLLNFNGKRGTNGVNLSWKSTNEKNVDYIEIWRKEKLGTDKLINKVKPYNNESGINNYSYTDRTATNDEQYYQLKIVDLDGTFSTSDFVVVPKMVKADDVSVFPNPANNYIYIKLEPKQLIRIYNSLGKLCQQTFVHEQDAVDISKLPNGIYYLRTEEKSTKFIVNR